ncbi:MAG TPA: ABC transporter ATP-binding protein [Candidatus Angelobacter sp.]|nr:ABC transporter ATP-binding protein [Candidatus Angelobacter sp.]
MTYSGTGLRVRYGEVLALDDVSVTIEPGSVVVVVGGDGAGKTTLLRSLVGEAPLESGTVVAPDAAGVGYLTAAAGSWPALTVRQNMDFVGGIYGLSDPVLASRRDDLLHRAGLSDARDRLASQLSGGMRRKLGFSMAMLHEPPLLVLDEPTTGVDPVSRVELWRLVSEAAASGAAVLMSTTYLDEAQRAGSLLALDGGRTLAQGSLEEVLGSLQGTVTVSDRPARPEWAWRRGRVHHEYWPAGERPPAGAIAAAPDLEDVVVALSLTRRHRSGAAA